MWSGEIAARIHRKLCAREKIFMRARDFDFEFLGEWNRRKEEC